MVREEILDDGTRLYWLTLGPGMPEEQVSGGPLPRLGHVQGP